MNTKKKLNNKKGFAFPPEEEMEKVIKRMTQPGYRRINQGLKPNATAEEKSKHELCKSIVLYAIKNHLNEKELREKLKIDQEKLEYILFCHINKLTLEELTHHSNVLNATSYSDNFLPLSKIREKNILLILKSYYNQ